jgi:hypothetical protein
MGHSSTTRQVANRRSDLDFSDLESDYGFGFRFNTDNGVVFRVDAAFGSRDGKHLHIVFGGIFSMSVKSVPARPWAV